MVDPCQCSLNALALSHLDCWCAGVDSPWLQVPCSNRGEPKDGAFAHVDAGGDAGPCGHPCVRANFHCIGQQRERWIVKVVRSAAEVRILREDRVRTEVYWRRVVDL